MAMVTVGYENSAPIELFYEDRGCGSPVVLVHGYPSSSQSWERQVSTLLQEGHRVITYDRRGGSRSSQPASGYDWDTLAGDLNVLLTILDVRQTVLVGHSVGTGDVMRYLRVYGSKRVTRAALIAPIPPRSRTLGAIDSPTHMDASSAADRYATLSVVVADYFDVDAYLGTRISPEVIRRTWDLCATSSPMLDNTLSLARDTDFSVDLKTIDVPVLVVIAGADRILPAGKADDFDLFARSKRVIIKGAPHGLLWTHGDEVNGALLEFIDA